MTRSSARTLLYAVLVGLGAGVAGVALIKVQQIVQALVYGDLGNIAESFFDEIARSTPEHRFIVLVLCGLVGGVGWVLIHRYGKPLVTIKKTVESKDARMPLGTTLAHAVLQTVTVAMGSPLGKEAAPRELSCAIAGTWLKHTPAFADDGLRKTLVASAAGAGLAAIYNAPLAGALFTLETLLLSWKKRDVAYALVASVVAVAFARLFLGDVITYPGLQFSSDGWTVVWGLLMGLVIALAVTAFEKTRAMLPKLDRKSPKMILLSVLCFAGIGVIAINYPLVLGNGQIGNQLTLAAQIDAPGGLAYFFAKWAAVLLALAAGAYGGNIQPSIMMGSALALCLAIAWNALGLPFIPVATAALMGGAAFLGVTLKMPITSAVFLLELARFSPGHLLAVCACIGTAVWLHGVLVKRMGSERE